MQIHANGTWQMQWGDIVFGSCLNPESLPTEVQCVRMVNQVHGAIIWSDRHYRADRQGDGLVTDLTHVCLVVRTADCVPVHISDGSRVAMLHAGWRGTAAGILTKLGRYFDLQQIRIVIGPSITQMNYEVGPDLYADWLDRDPNLANFLEVQPAGGDKRQFDLRGFVVNQLLELGVGEAAITQVDVCTFASPLPSYRRDGQRAGRILNYAYRSA